MGAPLDRLERAEPAPLAAPALAGGLRHEAAEPRRRRDQERHPQGVDRRRRDRSPRRRAAGCRPSTSSAAWAARAPVSTRTRTIRTRCRPQRRPSPAAARGAGRSAWRPSTASSTRLAPSFGPRTRIWLTELGYQTNPPDRILGVTWAKQARFVAEAQLRAYEASRVDLLVQYLVRDEPKLGAWQSGLETVAGKVEARDGLVHAAAGAGLPHRSRDHGLGAGPARHRPSAVPPPAPCRRGLGSRRRRRGDECAGVLHADRAGRSGHPAAALRPATRRSSPTLVVR